MPTLALVVLEHRLAALAEGADRFDAVLGRLDDREVRRGQVQSVLPARTEPTLSTDLSGKGERKCTTLEGGGHILEAEWPTVELHLARTAARAPEGKARNLVLVQATADHDIVGSARPDLGARHRTTDLHRAVADWTSAGGWWESAHDAAGRAGRADERIAHSWQAARPYQQRCNREAPGLSWVVFFHGGAHSSLAPLSNATANQRLRSTLTLMNFTDWAASSRPAAQSKGSYRSNTWEEAGVVRVCAAARRPANASAGNRARRPGSSLPGQTGEAHAIWLSRRSQS